MRQTKGGRAMKKVFFLSFLIVLAGGQQAWGDMAMLPFIPGVSLFEPKQRAMIAWNGKEEILLLSMDLRASQPTKVLQAIPLPSEPVVKKGDVETFRRAHVLIRRKLRPATLGQGLQVGEIAGRGAAGEVTFHEKIGAHDITVTHVLDSAGFIRWVEDTLRAAGATNPSMPEPLKPVIAAYLREGFKWFVFDVVSLDTRPKTSEAIQFRFAAKFLYYPLKVTRTAEGQTDIDLLVLSPRLLGKFSGFPIEQVELRHPPVSISSAELRSLNEEMDALLGHREDMKLRVWHIFGDLSSFEKDLIAR